MKHAAAFGRFWYDFIVGDSAVLAIGGVVILTATWVLSEIGVSTVAEIVAPGLVIATLWISLPRRKL
ncbi:MAG: hypothetical protein WD472_08000 [Dehalococcoidia bacterium]